MDLHIFGDSVTKMIDIFMSSFLFVHQFFVCNSITRLFGVPKLYIINFVCITIKIFHFETFFHMYCFALSIFWMWWSNEFRHGFQNILASSPQSNLILSTETNNWSSVTIHHFTERNVSFYKLALLLIYIRHLLGEPCHLVTQWWHHNYPGMVVHFFTIPSNIKLVGLFLTNHLYFYRNIHSK